MLTIPTSTGSFCVSSAKRADELVTIAGLALRVIRSPKNGKDDEPRFILTNDIDSSRNKIVRIYYHRFEVEETFRDVKSILGLRRTKLLKPNGLAILLWFVSLGVLLLYLTDLGVLGVRALRRRLTNRLPRNGCLGTASLWNYESARYRS